MVEHRLNNRELDRELAKVKFRSAKNQQIFEKISHQTWFRQYAKGSNEALKKITEKVKQGIKHNKYTSSDLGQPIAKGYAPPKKKVTPKKKTKGERKLQEQTKKLKKKSEPRIKEPEKVIKNDSRKKSIERRIKSERAPSGREYSKTEMREGKGSKRAREWRARNGVDINDYS